MSSRRVSLPVSFLLLAAGGLAACDADTEEPNENGHFYCTDSSGTVIDEDYCDDSSDSYNPGYFFMRMGSSMHAPPSGYSTYPRGTKLPPAASKFSVTDRAARQRFGLPTTGRVSNGTVKTGVVGKGGSGSVGGKAGSGGGAKGGSGGG